MVAQLGQKRRHSLVETLVNQGVGIALAVGINATILPLMGFNPTPANLTAVTAIYFASSMGRSYVLRRIFNLLHTKEIL